MKMIRIALLYCGLLWLGGCAQVNQTAQTLKDDNGVLMDAEEHYIGDRKFSIVMRGSSIILDGEVEQQFHRHAERVAKAHGCKDWTLVEYRAGNENTLLGARRYVEAIIKCLP